MKAFRLSSALIVLLFWALPAFAAGNSGGIKAGVIGGMMAATLGVAALIIWGVCRLVKKSSSAVAKKVKDKANNTAYKSTINTSYYAIAEQEVNSQKVDSGLWAKALVNAKGNEFAQKAEYIKLRTKQLKKAVN